MNDETFTKLPARINLPSPGTVPIPKTQDYLMKLNRVLQKMYSDIATILNGNVMTVGNNIWLFQSANGHWWKFEVMNNGMAETTDLGVTLPAEYQ